MQFSYRRRQRSTVRPSSAIHSAKFFRLEGFTLIELLVVIAIISILGAILMPVFAQARQKSYQTVCGSNLQQISMAMLLYAHDYDGMTVRVLGGNRTFADHDNQSWPVSWAPSSPVDGVVIPGLLDAYTKTGSRIGIFGCPAASGAFAEGRPATSYMYNELAAGKAAGEFAGPANTVMLVDGQCLYINAGHSAVALSGGLALPPDLQVDGKGYEIAGAYTNAFLASGGGRHSFGFNTVLADGHLKWFKMTQSNFVFPGKSGAPPVYFPERTNCSDSHESEDGAPAPGGDMKGYTATFHIR